MKEKKTYEWTAELELLGINPFVQVPEAILKAIFKQSGRDKSPIPIKGLINKKRYRQSLVKYRGAWRLYVNTTMLKNSPDRIGEKITVSIAHDPTDRSIPIHPKLLTALDQNKEAKAVFEGLPPSLQKEIVRYISFLKTEESIDKNVARAIDFLLGKGSFIGRTKP